MRALELAKELLQPAVVSIKTNQWGDTRGRVRAALCGDLGPGDSRVLSGVVALTGKVPDSVLLTARAALRSSRRRSTPIRDISTGP